MAGKKDYKKTKQYKALKKELEDDLESRGLISEPYKDAPLVLVANAE